jgi:hypothetical protein
VACLGRLELGLGARRPVGFAKVLVDQSLPTMEKVG